MPPQLSAEYHCAGAYLARRPLDPSPASSVERPFSFLLGSAGLSQLRPSSQGCACATDPRESRLAPAGRPLAFGYLLESHREHDRGELGLAQRPQPSQQPGNVILPDEPLKQRAGLLEHDRRRILRGLPRVRRQPVIVHHGRVVVVAGRVEPPSGAPRRRVPP